MEVGYPSYDEIREAHYKLTEMRTDYWLHHDLFSFPWWLLVSILILPWVIWWKYVDRRRLKDIILFGSLLMILVGLLDDIGVQLHLWSYPYQLINIMPSILPIDYGIIIVAHMFLFQYFRKWKTFLLANLMMATVFTFICEPITVWLEIYKLENWKYIYSLPIYILKAGFIRWLVEKISSKVK
jgi:hypothetical protein